MLQVLIVDDEPVAIRGIVKGIDWEANGFGPPHVAYDADDAMEIMQSVAIDLMICDIEMPEVNGLELLAWANEHCPGVKTIFLTGHASFEYAQKAIQEGSLDYLLKPVEHDVLQTAIDKALEKIEQVKRQEAVHENYELYQSLYQKQKPVVTERLWQDIVQYRIVPKAEEWNEHFRAHQLPLRGDSLVMPILVSIEQWQEILSQRDEEIMGYALRKAAEETFLDKRAGIVVGIAEGLNLVLLYGSGESGEVEAVREEARTYVRFSQEHFRCKLSCYIAEPTPVTRIAGVYESLLAMEKANVSNVCSVQLLSEEPLPQVQLQASPAFSDWGALLETGKERELLLRLDESIDKLRSSADQESMDAYYFGLINLLYQVFHNKGVFIREVYRPGVLEELLQHPRSIVQLQKNAAILLSGAAKYIGENSQGKSAMLVKVQQYVEDHLTDDLSREQIAEHVRLNAAYLSRWFKKETGRSLSEYVLEAKMNKAKRMLVDTNMKVSFIAESLGYLHDSHFAKIFKKAVGLTPFEYRKQYQ
ncbi:response regulator [Cohnella yongneupensis]|uniref:Response regulator n=1 Tax=Cohnella yongneupensis TaxID=425006 RepID=A0ABW0R4G5_9BACL